MDENVLIGENNMNRDATVETPQEAVRNLQRYLRKLSYVYEEIPPVPVDGIFDTHTEVSLKAFQKMAGLPVTGRADRETWTLLYQAYLDALFRSSEPRALPLFPISPEDYTIKRGDEGFLVSAIQFLLGELETLYSFPVSVTVNGVYDEATERAITEVERAFLLPPTGKVNKRLWNYLVGVYIAEDSGRESAYSRITKN